MLKVWQVAVRFKISSLQILRIYTDNYLKPHITMIYNGLFFFYVARKFSSEKIFYSMVNIASIGIAHGFSEIG